MDPRAHLSGTSGTAPTAPSSPSVGYPTGGNPLTNTPPTNPGPYWFHQIAEELRNVLVAGGQTPAQGTLTQLKSALDALYGNVLTTAGTPDGFKIGSLTVQFGFLSSSNGTFSFPHAFSTACLAIFASNSNSQGSNNDNAFAYPISTTQFTAGTKSSTGSISSYPIYWIAIGW